MPQFPVAGKVPADFLKTFIYDRCGAVRPEVRTGPRHGVDTAIIDLPGGLALALTTDPLSLVPSLGLRESAWLSVHLMASDIATTGCAPQYALLELNLPPDMTEADFAAWWNHVHKFCEDLGVAIVGGHTARFEGQRSTVVGGGMMASVARRDELLTSAGGRPGDVLIVTRQCALAATSILAYSFPKTIRERCGADMLQEGRNLFYQTSAVSAALQAVTAGRGAQGVTAMHDATEGGVIGALVELAEASACGLRVYKDRIPVGTAVEQICSCFGIDPMLCVSAGALIIATAPDRADAVRQVLAAIDIPAAVVGELLPAPDGMQLIENGISNPLVHPGIDPYWRAFYDAWNKGWK